MSDHDGDPLGVALADLADTVPADPYRVEAVHDLVRRRRTRRRVRRSALGVVAAAATIAGLVAVQNRSTSVTSVPATSPPATTAAPSPCPAAVKGGTAGASADQRGFKGTGSLLAVSDASVTIQPEELAPDEPAQLTAAITPNTEFIANDQKLPDRPALAVGDRVAFAAQAADSGYTLVLLDTKPPTPDTGQSAAQKASPSGASGTSDTLRGFKGLGTLVAVTDSSVTIHPAELQAAEPAELTATITSSTEFVDQGNALSARPALTAGEEVAFAAQVGDSGYTLVVLETNPVTAPDPSRAAAAQAAAAEKAAAAAAAGGADPAAKPCPPAGS
jgi:hypothetical protein